MDLFKECYTVGKYEISSICLQTYPCKHRVTNTETNETRMYSGDKIYTLLKNDGLSHKHFDQYAEFIRKQYFPTCEEIAQKLASRMEIERQNEIRRKEGEEKQKIIDSTKASSVLSKLKSKCGVLS